MKQNKKRSDKDNGTISDTSPKIHNPPKINFELDLKPLNWTEKQKQFIEIAKTAKIIICKSPAGTGKTILSLYCALEKLKQKRHSKIYFLRNPVESASHGIGFTPGETRSKMLPYLMPAIDNLKQLLPEAQINRLINEEILESLPIGFLKGRSLGVCSLICDESEDLSVQETLLVMTRLSKFATLFIIGDEKQTNVKDSGFVKVFNLFDNEESKNNGIYTFSFNKSDIMRNEVLSYILDKFEEMDIKSKLDKEASKTKDNYKKIEDWIPGSK